MRFGFDLHLHLTPLQIEGLTDALLGTEFNWVELKYPFDIPGYDPSGYVQAVQRFCRRYKPGLSVHIPTFLDVALANEGLRQETLRQVRLGIEWAGAIGAEIAVLHPGSIGLMDVPPQGTANYESLRPAYERKIQQAFKQAVASVKELAADVRRAGVKLAVENLLHEEQFVNSPQQHRQFLDDVAEDGVVATLDFGHAFRAGYTPEAFVAVLGKDLAHVHINDNDGTCDMHWIPGRGKIDYRPGMQALRQMDYRGAVMFEVSPERVPDDYFTALRVVRQALEG